ncbi:Peptidase inhibitor 16, variant 2 [Schistosoma haematobium]|uniref:Peptidase inhibitor 16, variant 2 n=1 Tax=Schistosoma haematobium TaxID=6185 RepID=A0A922LFP6_SCHHA|nr:Peptidase inhibitor 16, variant 2 [Schistosoma haematobium]KAH9581379.1 Peptidase inhibitor 16, variant 2 [Schistosoma haematobium]
MQAVHTNHLFNMHKTQFSLIVLVLLNVYGNRAIFWNIENSELLVLHNAYRRDIKYGTVLDQPKADSMLKLQWSHKLAKLAQAWAFHCVPTRSNLTMRDGSKWTYVGQNIAVVSKVRE